MNTFWRVTPWLFRLILLAVTVLFTLISWRYLANPVANAPVDGITPDSVMALSRLRIGFGAFPLAFAILLLVAVSSEKRLLAGLVGLSIVLGVVTAVRLAGLLIDGTAPEAMRLLGVELVLWIVSLAGIALEILRRRRGSLAAAAASGRVPEAPARYHPALVVLHWIMAVFLLAAILLGMFVLKETPNASPDKLHALRAHMGGGIVIVALMAARAIVRFFSAKPRPADAGHPLLDRLARISHYGFYALVFLMGITGVATALLAGLFPIVFGGSGGALPDSFFVYPTRVLHGYIAKTLLALIAVHVLAVAYHQLFRRDGLLRRMALGRRWGTKAQRGVGATI